MPRVVLNLPKPVRDELRRLVQTGLYGPTIAAAAERLICQHLVTKRRWTERPPLPKGAT